MWEHIRRSFLVCKSSSYAECLREYITQTSCDIDLLNLEKSIYEELD
jgi:hypothetical protein